MNLDSKKLSDILAIIEPAVMKIDSVPMLKNILITASAVSAYNLKIGCYAETDLFQEFPEFLVPFVKLNAFVRNTKDQVEANIQDMVLELKSGRSSAKIPIDEPTDFVRFDETLEKISDKKISISSDFAEGLKFSAPFVSRVRPILTGIHISESFIEATDGQRISRFKMDSPIPFANFVVPSEFGKALKNSDHLFFDDTKVIIWDENVVYFSNIIVGEYPKIEKYFPQPKRLMKLPCKEMIIALKKVGDFTEEKEYAEAIISFKEGIDITYEGKTSHISEFLDFGRNLPSTIFKSNPYILLNILGKCEKFSFQEVEYHLTMYGISENGKFSCVVALEKIE